MRERIHKLEAHQTKPKIPNLHPKEINSVSNAKQGSSTKTISDIKETARTTSWPASKAIQIESIEAPHPSLLEDNTRRDLLYITETYVTYKIQCKYPNFNFSKVLYSFSK